MKISKNDYKQLVANNMIRNCPITVKDIDIAEKVYGKSVGALKGKTVRFKPIPVVKDYVEVPPDIIKKNHSLL